MACCRPAKILLPKEGTDLSKWAVVACDQFTSEPEYWKEADELVGDAPSTLRITLPEVYLEEARGGRPCEEDQRNDGGVSGGRRF